jgi:flagellar protein FlaG
MDQISVNLTAPVTLSSPVENVIPSVEARVLTRAVSTAVNNLNSSGYAGAGRELTFSVDQATKKPIIKVIETDTKEVISQWPPEYLLQLAAENSNDKRDSG